MRPNKNKYKCSSFQSSIIEAMVVAGFYSIDHFFSFFFRIPIIIELTDFIIQFIPIYYLAIEYRNSVHLEYVLYDYTLQYETEI
jgi:hypothetical protein